MLGARAGYIRPGPLRLCPLHRCIYAARAVRVSRSYFMRAMPTHIALLRAINVGGTGKLPMADLRTLCETLGFHDVRTYIQSGNVVFTSALDAAKAKAKLEKALALRLGKPCRVLLRSRAELEAVDQHNPFPDAPPNRVIVMFLDEAPDKVAIVGVKTPGGEQLAPRGRELYIHYPDGQGVSKLKTPFADIGTGRNINTVRKLVELAST